MMRRYADAIRTFSHILLYVQRTKPLYQAKTYQNDQVCNSNIQLKNKIGIIVCNFCFQINKQTEKMYVLLSVCLVLHPQRIDESLQAVLREKPHAERITRMQKGELQVYRDLNNEFFFC